MSGGQSDVSRSFQYELGSLAAVENLARTAMPLGIDASSPRRSFHRDIYLDTSDDSLRRRGVVCLIRLAGGGARTLSIRISASSEHDEVRVDSVVRGVEIPAALREDTPAGRRLAALADLALLVPRTELVVDRLTRKADPDWLRRPRIELHYDQVTISRDGLSRTFYRFCGHARRGQIERLHRLAHALEEEHDLRPLAFPAAERGELLIKWARRGQPDSRDPGSDSVHRIPNTDETETDLAAFLNPELSLLAFQLRVLALAENPTAPLQERLRFLGIVSANLDEFFMVRMTGLRAAGREESDEQAGDGMTRSEQLEKILSRVSEITKRQAACYQECRRKLHEIGFHILEWSQLDRAEQEELRARCRDEILPALTPLAMTLSPGHPMPYLPHLALSLAVVFRGHEGDRPHLAELELPTDSLRFMPVSGRSFSVIPLEQVVRASLDLLYPNARADGAYLFRVTRAGDLALDESAADDLLEAVAHATGRRALNPAIRVEVERDMPAFVRDLVRHSLCGEIHADGAEMRTEEFEEAGALLDLRCLGELTLPSATGLCYEPFTAGDPVSSDTSLFAEMRGRDLLFHHPFASFAQTVLRFVREASEDPDVTAIKMTLYRVGPSSPIVDALLQAARNGKRVAVFLELKARFDEDHNVTWAHALERAGANVVYGLVGLKNHSKVTLVVRREEGKLRRYVHVGTGNYNARSALQYTDLSLFSAREDLGADIADLFNELTGSSRPPQGLSRGALVAPHQLLPALLEHIEREADHARSGRAARITAKLNGLSDPEIVRALYRASSDGVEIDLIVRGICTLRPGVTGLSERIRVISVVGRFLEHSRIYRFENGGAPVHLIGSSDLRPRNLRRRVELLVPVDDSANRALLDHTLEIYLRDSRAWELESSGEYLSRGEGSSSAQERLITELAKN